MQEDGRLTVGEPGFKRDYPREAGGLGNEERDEECVFHIGCCGGGAHEGHISGRAWEGLGLLGCALLSVFESVLNGFVNELLSVFFLALYDT